MHFFIIYYFLHRLSVPKQITLIIKVHHFPLKLLKAKTCDWYLSKKKEKKVIICSQKWKVTLSENQFWCNLHFVSKVTFKRLNSHLSNSSWSFHFVICVCGTCDDTGQFVLVWKYFNMWWEKKKLRFGWNLEDEFFFRYSNELFHTLEWFEVISNFSF